MAADQCGARAAAHQPDPGPQVRVDLQVPGDAAVPVRRVQRVHAVLAGRLGAAEDLLRARDLLRVQLVEQRCRRQPGVLTPGAGRGEHGFEAHWEIDGTQHRRELVEPEPEWSPSVGELDRPPKRPPGAAADPDRHVGLDATRVNHHVGPRLGPLTAERRSQLAQ